MNRSMVEIAQELTNTAQQLENVLSIRANLELQLADLNDQVNAAAIRVAELKAELAKA